MKLTKQVVSLELAKKLKELGMKQESLFYWTERVNVNWWEKDSDLTYIELTDNITNEKGDIEDEPEMYQGFIALAPAYTVAELLKILPKEMGGDYGGILLLSWVNGKEWQTTYYSFYNQKTASQLENMPHMYTLADKNADSLSKMLIYLLENNLTSL